MIEVPVCDSDRVDVRPLGVLTQPAEDARPAVEQHAATVRLQHVPGVRASGFGHAGDEPMTVRRTAVFCPCAGHDTSGYREARS